MEPISINQILFHSNENTTLLPKIFQQHLVQTHFEPNDCCGRHSRPSKAFGTQTFVPYATFEKLILKKKYWVSANNFITCAVQ